MLTGEAFALTITAAIAKHFLSKWLGDKWYNQVGQDLVDLLRDTAVDKSARAKSSKEIGKIASSIAVDADSWIERELPNLEPAERTEVIVEAAKTLAKARLNVHQLIEIRLDPLRLNQMLRKNQPNATIQFTYAGTALYDRIIIDASRGIIKYAAKLPEFDVAMASATMSHNDDILEHILNLQHKSVLEIAEFERQYLEAILRRLDRLELFGLRQIDQITEQQRLSIAYITLSWASVSKASENSYYFSGHESDSVFKETQKRSTLAFDVCRELWDQLPHLEAEDLSANLVRIRARDKATSLRLWHDFSATNLKRQDICLPGARGVRILTLGKAGSGKTTLLQGLAIAVARSGLAKDKGAAAAVFADRFPFFVRLREYTGKRFPSPEEFVRATTPMIAGSMPKGWVHKILEDGRALVLVDGLDEVPQSERNDMLNSLRELVDTYPRSWYVITSRPAAIAEDKWPEWVYWTQKAQFATVVLQDMTPTQVDQLIDHWHAALSESVSDPDERDRIKGLPSQLKRQLSARPELQRLTVNPLLCAMICAVHHERRQDLPRERARLYAECVEMLLNRRDSGRRVNLSDYPLLTESQKLSLAKSIAYWFLKNGYTSAPVEEVERHISSMLGLLQSHQATPEGVRRLFVERTDLMREPIAGQIDFTHRTFLEYLAAQAAVDTNDFGLLLNNAQDDQWRETIILAVGEARPYEAAKFLADLVKKLDGLDSSEGCNQLCLLAAACLETPVMLEREVRDLVLTRTAALLPPRNDDSVGQIAKVGAPIVPLLGPNRDYSSEEAAYCVDVLAQIGSEAAMEVISKYAVDERELVIRALSRAWPSFDRQEYLKRVLGNLNLLRVDVLPSTSELAQLQKLTRVEVEGSEIRDISALAMLSNLRDVLVNCPGLPDLKSVGRLQGIRRLRLSSPRCIDNVDDLRGLNGLEALLISSIGEIDVSAISQLQRIERLDVLCEEVHSAHAIAQIAALHSLGLPLSQFLAIRDLPRIRDLRALRLYGAGVHDFSAQMVAHMPNLAELYLSNQGDFKDKPIVALRDLRLLSGMTDLTLGEINFDISDLVDIQGLSSLLIYRGQVHNIEAIQRMTQLKELRLTDENIGFSLELVAGLSGLSCLDIRGLRDRDLSKLRHMPELANLVVRADQAQDLELLPTLPSLRRLEVWGGGRIDWSAIVAIPGLAVRRA